MIVGSWLNNFRLSASETNNADLENNPVTARADLENAFTGLDIWGELPGKLLDGELRYWSRHSEASYLTCRSYHLVCSDLI